MNNWIDRHPFLSFYILALLIGVMAFGVIFAGGPELLATMEEARQKLGLNFFSIFIVAYMVFTMPEPIYALGVVFPAAPSIAAIIIVASRAGKGGIGDLFSRYLPWRGGVPGSDALKTYVALLLGLMALLIVHETFIVVRQGNELFANVVSVYGLDSLLTFFGLYLLGTTMEMGAFFEELGWRGYGYPVLKKILGSPLKTAVLLGLLWGIWHMPRDLTVLLTGISVFEFLLSQVNFYLATIGITVMILFFMNRVGGSIIPAILIHGWFNYLGLEQWGIGETLRATREPVLFGFINANTIMIVAVALLIIWLAGPDLGLRKDGTGEITDPGDAGKA